MGCTNVGGDLTSIQKLDLVVAARQWITPRGGVNNLPDAGVSRYWDSGQSNLFG